MIRRSIHQKVKACRENAALPIGSVQPDFCRLVWPVFSSFRCEGEMRMRSLIASLIVLAVLYFWDKNYNDSKFADGLAAIRRDISHSMFN